MKKKIAALMLVLLCFVIAVSGCGLGNYIEKGENKDPSGAVDPDPTPPDPDDPDNPDKPDNPDVPDDTHYTASVYYNNAPFNPADAEITVVWHGDYEVVRVPLGADGKASAGELDGDFHVYLEGLPEKYAYDPNGYRATSDERSVAMLLVDITNPIDGTGSGLYVGDGCYQVKYDGTYRAEIAKKNKYVYYEYKPVSAGWYQILSWVNAFENKVNPVLQQYNGSSAFKWAGDVIDEGGFSLDGGYTKNFCYDVYIDKQYVGNPFTFAITAQVQSGEYPVNVDFSITYRGEYVSEDSDIRVITAEEAYLKAAEKKSYETFVFADGGYYVNGTSTYVEGTKYFDAESFKYNEDTGFYHHYSETLYGNDPYFYGANYGPIACCVLKRQLPSYTATTLYDANKAGNLGGSNYLRLYHCWIESEQKYAVFDYTSFIRNSYGSVCNADGVCYVTKELKEFLERYADRQAFWTDGMGADSEGTPESLGYVATKDSMWQFACGYYTKLN